MSGAVACLEYGGLEGGEDDVGLGFVGPAVNLGVDPAFGVWWLEDGNHRAEHNPVPKGWQVQGWRSSNQEVVSCAGAPNGIFTLGC